MAHAVSRSSETKAEVRAFSGGGYLVLREGTRTHGRVEIELLPRVAFSRQRENDISSAVSFLKPGLL